MNPYLAIHVKNGFTRNILDKYGRIYDPQKQEKAKFKRHTNFKNGDQWYAVCPIEVKNGRC